MKKQFFTALLASNVLMGGAALAEDMGAQTQRLQPQKQHMQEKQVQEKTDEFLDAVDATDAQKVQIRAIENKYRAQMLSMQQDEMRAQTDLMNYVFSTNATQAEATRRQEELLKNRQRAEELMLRAAFEKKAVLTPEQQREASKFFAEAAEDRAEDAEDAADEAKDKAEDMDDK